jgi:predicted short-subunit dehydrogenase-like oxidoreductase (DUF2520 family)
MDRPHDIAIVGRGRLGRTVARKLRAAGVETLDLGRGDTIPPAPVTWLLVPDRAIAEVSALVPSGGVVLHSSGALGAEALAPHIKRAVLHPIMSFPGDTLPDRVPATLAGEPEAVDAARRLAESLGWEAIPFAGDRALYHAACVMAGNFAGALFEEACTALSLAGVDPGDAPGLLGPLARASLENAIVLGPSALTGPAARGDRAVVERHRSALGARDRTLLAVYDALSAATDRILAKKGA